MNEEKIETTLKGNTLRVYWYLLGKSDGIEGARELQRASGFSSSALAVHHLDKLADVGPNRKHKCRLSVDKNGKRRCFETVHKIWHIYASAFFSLRHNVYDSYHLLFDAA